MKTLFLRNHRAWILITFLISAAFIYTGCSKSSNSGMSGPGANEVWMKNTAFDPASITVSVNSTVTWTNKDGYSHDVTATDSSFYSGTIPSGATYTHQFTTAGTYTYRCTFHPGMTGVVVVKGGY